VGFELYNDDCFNVFPLIPDRSVDAIICDLPYGTTQNKWDSVLPLDELWEQYKRVIKINGAIVLTSSEPFTSHLIISNLIDFKYCFYWDKVRPKNHLNAKIQPMRAIEPIVIFYKEQPTYNPILTKKRKQDIRDNGRTYQSTNNGNYGDVRFETVLNEFRTVPIDLKYPDDLITINGVGSFGKEKNSHSTQKPIALMKYLVLTYTNENETVLDNCMGSGTTGVACKLTNRKFIGIEKEPEYFKIAQKRISETQAGGLFF